MKTQTQKLSKLTKPITLHVIIHQHWDPAWISRRKDTVPQLIILFNDIFKKLEKYPSYKFTLDQTHIIEDFLSQLPQKEAIRRGEEIKKYVRERRLMIAPFYSQLDWNLSNGELLVRNLLIGHREAQEFGGMMKSGWVIDVFGFPDATPRILQGFGISNVFISRGIGIEPNKVKEAYIWESSDGSKVICFHLIESYRNLMDLAEIPEIAKQRIISKAKKLLPFSSTGKHVLLFDGYENQAKADDIVPIVEKVNLEIGKSKVIICSPNKYAETIKLANPSLSTVKGDLNSGKYIASLQGVLSNRVYLKRKHDACQRLLGRLVEPFWSLAWSLGRDYPVKGITDLWKKLLRISCHDEICGCSIDDVHLDAEIKYDEIINESCRLTSEALTTLSQAVDTSCVKGDIGLVVFNPSPWKRTGIVKMIVELPPQIKMLSLTDAADKPVPSQIGNKDKNKREVYFFTDGIPSLGYGVFGLTGKCVSTYWEFRLKISEKDRTIENPYVKVNINDDGTIVLLDKRSGKRYERIGYFKSEGDRGDLYTASCLKEGVVTSLNKKAIIKLVNAGPLFARYKIKQKIILPIGLNYDRRLRSKKSKEYPLVTYIELKADSPRVDFKTIVQNVVKDHRLRVCFPTGLKTYCCHVEKQFDVAKLPIRVDSSDYSNQMPPLKGIISPAWDTVPPDGRAHQNFVDVSDGEKGLGLISKGLPEFNIDPNDNTLELTLIRGVGWLGLDDLPVRRGRAGWKIRTSDAQCLGIHTFCYSILPHEGNWFRGRLHVASEDYNSSLAVVQTDFHSGLFPSNLEFVRSESNPKEALIITSVKLSEDESSLVIRFYNPLDQRVKGKLKIYPHLKRAFFTNINEDIIREVPIENDQIPVEVSSKKIVTVKIELVRGKKIEGISAKDCKLIDQHFCEEEEKSKIKKPQLIRTEDICEEKKRVTETNKKLKNAKARLTHLEKNIGGSKNPSDRLRVEMEKMNVFKVTEEVQDAEYSYLLSSKKYIELYEKDIQVKQKKVEFVQRKIGKMVKDLIKPRADRQRQEFVLEYYRGLISNKQNNQP